MIFRELKKKNTFQRTHFQKMAKIGKFFNSHLNFLLTLTLPIFTEKNEILRCTKARNQVRSPKSKKSFFN